LESYDIKGFLKKKIKGPLKFHHEFRISISDCPNACSRPQIVDIGLIGASVPTVAGDDCSQCMACVEACKEGAVDLFSDNLPPAIYPENCICCGQCISACAMDVIQEEKSGYRVLLGGRLGRHPQLGRELEGIYSPKECIEIVKKCLKHFFSHYREGERLGDIINRTGIDFL
jgi:dissimilatory sulfite reductase (desulfoviridin) alpha/beta subunit